LRRSKEPWFSRICPANRILTITADGGMMLLYEAEETKTVSIKFSGQARVLLRQGKSLAGKLIFPYSIFGPTGSEPLQLARLEQAISG
jgi:hypothetical protein